MNRHKYLKPAFVCLVCLFGGSKTTGSPSHPREFREDRRNVLSPRRQAVCHRRTVLLHQFRPTATTTDRRNVLSLTSIHWALLSLTVLPAVLARFSFTTRNVFFPPLKPRYVRNERCPRSRWRDDHGRPRARHWTCIGDRRRRHRRPRTGRSRASGRTLSRALSAGVTECGGDVIDVGVQPTPTVARSVVREGADAGVVVTASHNPAPDNGIKLWAADGRAFDEDENDRIAEIVEEAAFNLGAWDELGEHRHVDGARERHERALRESVAIPDDLSVVVDLGNGVGRQSPPTRSTRPAVTWRRSTPSETGGSRDGRASPRPRTARRPAWSSRPPTRTSGSFTTATPIG